MTWTLLSRPFYCCYNIIKLKNTCKKYEHNRTSIRQIINHPMFIECLSPHMPEYRKLQCNIIHRLFFQRISKNCGLFDYINLQYLKQQISIYIIIYMCIIYILKYIFSLSYFLKCFYPKSSYACPLPPEPLYSHLIQIWQECFSVGIWVFRSNSLSEQRRPLTVSI